MWGFLQMDSVQSIEQLNAGRITFTSPSMRMKAATPVNRIIILVGNWTDSCSNKKHLYYLAFSLTVSARKFDRSHNNEAHKVPADISHTHREICMYTASVSVKRKCMTGWMDGWRESWLCGWLGPSVVVDVISGRSNAVAGCKQRAKSLHNDWSFLALSFVLGIHAPVKALITLQFKCICAILQGQLWID